MLCKCYWIVLYTVHVTAFSLGGGRFCPDTVYVVGYIRSPSSLFALSAVWQSLTTDVERNEWQ